MPDTLCLTLPISSSTPGRALMSRATPRRARQAARAGAVLRCSAGLAAGPPAAAVAREKLPLVRSRSRDPRLGVPARVAACRVQDGGHLKSSARLCQMLVQSSGSPARGPACSETQA